MVDSERDRVISSNWVRSVSGCWWLCRCGRSSVWNVVVLI